MKRLRLIMLMIVTAVLTASGIIVAFYGPVAAIAAFTAMTAAVCFAAGWMVFHVAILRKSDKSVILSAPHNALALGQAPQDAQRNARHERWLEQVTLEEVSIKSTDDLELYAVVIPNRPDSHRWVVVCHGYADIGKEHMMFIAQTFHEMGYWVLMPDARGHGKSGGDTIGMGWLDRMDILHWIQIIGERNNTAEIVLYGISMGASTVMMVSGEPLPLTVKGIIADCGYTSVIKELAYQLKKLCGLPSFPVMQIFSLITRIFAGYWPQNANALRQVAKSRTPILFIHGSTDTFIPPYMLDELYSAAVCPKQKMLVEGAGHGQSSTVDRTRYWQTISDFLASI